MLKNNAFAAFMAAFVFMLFTPISVAQEELETPIPVTAVGAEQITVTAMEKEQGAVRSIGLGSSSGGAGIPALTMKTNPDGSEDYSVNLQILALMTMLGFLPAMVILMTSFALLWW